MSDVLDETTPNPPDLVAENAELQQRVFELEESWDEAAAALLRIRAEDKGWRPLSQVEQQDGFSLDVMKKVGEEAEVQAVGNPLLTRGFALRFDGIFSKHFRVSGNQPPRVQRRLATESVQRVLMVEDAVERNERTLFTKGNLFVAVNQITGQVKRIPFREITNRATDPDDGEVTAYYARSYTRTDFNGVPEPVSEWYPVLEWAEQNPDHPAEIHNHPVNTDWVIVDMRVNVPSGGHWGIPDCFAALPYAWAYSEYIRDASGLLKALNTIAWKIVAKNKKTSEQAGVRMSRAGQKPGGVASMTEGTDLVAMPRAGQVDMNDGVALAAMAAAALQVPVTALLSNAAIGGGFGAVASLDGPTVAMARARQKRWNLFYKRVFRALGLRDLELDFPKITEDPIHRQVASLATGRATGAIWADEYRNAFIEAMSVTPTREAAPPVEEYAQAQNALGFLSAMQGAVASGGTNDPLARQGNVGVAGSLGDIDNTNRDMDTQPGTGSMTGVSD